MFKLTGNYLPRCVNTRSKLTIRDHSFSTYAKFSEKLTFLTPHPHPPDTNTYLVRIRCKKCWFFGKFCVRTKWMTPKGTRAMLILNKYLPIGQTNLYQHVATSASLWVEGKRDGLTFFAWLFIEKDKWFLIWKKQEFGPNFTFLENGSKRECWCSPNFANSFSESLIKTLEQHL